MGVGCHKLKSLGKLSNGWTDWHHIWQTSADPSGNRYTPNKLPLETQGALGGGKGSTIQKYGEAVRLTPTLVHVCRFIWEWTYAKYNSPLNTPGEHFGRWGGVGCHKFKSLGKLSNDWTDWHKMWQTSADPSGTRYTPNKLPLETQGAWWVLGVKYSNIRGSCQTAGPIATNFGSRLRIHLGMDIG